MKIIVNVLLNILMTILYTICLYMMFLPAIYEASIFTRLGWFLFVALPFFSSFFVGLLIINIDDYLYNNLRDYKPVISGVVLYIPYLIITKTINFLRGER